MVKWNNVINRMNAGTHLFLRLSKPRITERFDNQLLIINNQQPILPTLGFTTSFMQRHYRHMAVQHQLFGMASVRELFNQSVPFG